MRTRLGVACVLLFVVDGGAPRSEGRDPLVKVIPPAPEAGRVETFERDGYPVHISVGPEYGITGKKSVLVLGMFSDADSVADARAHVMNPATGKPYDIIIGVGKGDVTSASEIVRSTIEGHLDPSRNAAALQKVLSEQIGVPIDAASVDMHSNGAAVGLAAFENGTFGRVAAMNLMGPDTGFGARRIDADRLEELGRAHGVETIRVHEIDGDFIPDFGRATSVLQVTGEALADKAAGLVVAAIGDRAALAALAEAPPAGGPRVERLTYDHPYSLNPLGYHYLGHYAAVRVGPGGPDAANRDAILASLDPMTTVAALDADPQISITADMVTALGRQLVTAGAAIVADASAVLATVTPEVGGVLLHFHDVDAVGVESLPALIRGLAGAAGSDQPFVVRAGDRELALVAVSLREQLASGAADLGALTRLRGYVIDGDDLLLLGLAEPGRPPIALDVVAALIQTVWKRGESPWVSLDPDPADLAGAQVAHVGGVPDALRKSAMVAILLDADYAMKRISLGEDVVDAPGLETLYHLVERDPIGGAGVSSRFWLTPVQSGVAELLEATDGGRSAVVFDSRVQVLTERMKRVGDYLAGTGDVDPLSEAAARSFTIHLDAIAVRRPIFAELAAVFDVAKLGAVLRARGVAHPLLDQLAARTVPVVDVAASYAGIGPRTVGNTSVTLSGGANTRLRVRPTQFAPSPELAAGLAAGDVGTLRVPMPATVPLDAARARDVDAELALQRGIERFAALDHAGAERLLTQAIDEQRDLAAAHAYRALARLEQGKVAEAMADVDVAVASEPALLGLRAALVARAGDHDRALADATAAIADHPDDPGVLYWAASARIDAFDLPAADEAIGKLLAIAPLDPDGFELRTYVELLYRLGPTRARARVDQMRRAPIPIVGAMLDGTRRTRALDYAGAIEAYRTCADAAGRTADPAAKELHLEERCLVGEAIAASAQAKMLGQVDPDAAAAVTEQASAAGRKLVAMHPDWATGHLLGTPMNLGVAARAAFERARTATGADPLFDDLSVMLGTRAVMGIYGFTAWYAIEDKSSAAAGALLDEVIPYLPSPARELWNEAKLVDRLPARAALQRLRAACRALPDPLPADVVTAWSAGYAYMLLVNGEQQFGGTTDGARDAAMRYLRITRDLEGLSWESLTQVAAFRLELVMSLDEATRETWNRDPEVVEIREQVGRGALAPPAARPRLDEIRARLTKSLGGGSRFVEGFVASSLIGAQGRLLDELVPAGADAPSSGAEWAVMLDGAETLVEVRTVALLFDMLRAGFSQARAADPKGAAELERVLTPLLARVTAVAQRPPVHAWATWSDPRTATASGGRSRKWPWVAAGAGAVAVGAVMLWIRRRRRVVASPSGPT